MGQDTPRIFIGAGVVVSVGEGLWALARRCAESFKIALIPQSLEVVFGITEHNGTGGGLTLAAQSEPKIETETAASYDRIVRHLAPAEIPLYHGGRPIGRLMETTPEVFGRAAACLGYLSMGAGGRAVDGLGRQRRNSDNGRDGREPALAVSWLNSAAFTLAKFAPCAIWPRSSVISIHRASTLSTSASTATSICPWFETFWLDVKKIGSTGTIADAFRYLVHHDRSIETHEMDARTVKEQF